MVTSSPNLTPPNAIISNNLKFCLSKLNPSPPIIAPDLILQFLPIIVFDLIIAPSSIIVLSPI